MTRKKHSRFQTILILFILFFAFVVALPWAANRVAVNHVLLDWLGERTMATFNGVLQNSTNVGGPKSGIRRAVYFLDVNWIDRENRPHQDELFMYESRRKLSLKKGDSVEILYLPFYPYFAELVVSEEKRGFQTSGIVVALISWGIILAFLAFLFFA